MPQGRRKVPFSAKQKKAQLQSKREQKKARPVQSQQTNHPHNIARRPFVSDDGDIEDELDDESGQNDSDDLRQFELIQNPNGKMANDSNPSQQQQLQQQTQLSQPSQSFVAKIHNVNAQKNLASTRGVNRYALQFFTESDQEIRERKERAQKPFELLDEKDGLVCTVEDLYGEAKDVNGIPMTNVDMPKRPKWSSKMSSAELNQQEQRYFTNYLNELFDKAKDQSLSYFDLNLETWRQLWRVIEMSDIVLLVSDIRHPLFHFPPSLYHHVVDDLGKDMILVLNKIDLVDSGLVLAWREYLQKRFPKLNILEFASYAGMRVRSSSRKRVGKLRMAVKGASSLQSMVSKIVGTKIDLSSWKQKIETELRETENASMDDDSSAESEDEDEGKRYNKSTKGTVQARLEKKADHVIIERSDTGYYEQVERFKDGIVTIGCVGHPNVGKSSLLNALYGKKVVSVSRTPGHTKHFQTIFLTDNVRLCDCPGLVFPSHAPKALQVLMGCYPISQLREPYTAIGYMAERINLVRLLRLQHPEGDTENVWSAYDICEAWAEKRGFLTARTARPDIYRAANHLLRMALDGRTICLAFQPVNYHEHEPKYWLEHSERLEIESIQNRQLVEETKFLNKRFKLFINCSSTLNGKQRLRFCFELKTK
ncbi:Guanine nucleotide-binding-like protein 1 [Blomia tropicalis]|nr:Guanine nucleotide-binding-like protein 1 [Blomia tropicalis]